MGPRNSHEIEIQDILVIGFLVVVLWVGVNNGTASML
jgi:hypothetical protein